MLCAKQVFIQDKHTGGILNVPCGRCMACRIRRARMWSIRIVHESKAWPQSCFVTLTYDSAHLPKNLSLDKTDVQLFLKRLRKSLGRSFRYFIGAEYGEHGLRPHYHAIFFGLGPADRQPITDAWGKGYVHLGTLTHDSANYVASYTLKKLSGPASAAYLKRGVIPEFSLMSRRPGIGAHYAETNASFIKQTGFCIVKGNKAALPRFYQDKVFTDQDKALLQALRQEFHEESFDKLMTKAGAEYGYQALDYQKGQRAQVQADLKAQADLKRRKL